MSCKPEIPSVMLTYRVIRNQCFKSKTDLFYGYEDIQKNKYTIAQTSFRLRKYQFSCITSDHFLVCLFVQITVKWDFNSPQCHERKKCFPALLGTVQIRPKRQKLICNVRTTLTSDVATAFSLNCRVDLT